MVCMGKDLNFPQNSRSQALVRELSSVLAIRLSSCFSPFWCLHSLWIYCSIAPTACTGLVFSFPYMDWKKGSPTLPAKM